MHSGEFYMRMLTVLAILSTSMAHAADVEIGWQARILDTTGNPLEGSHSVVLSLYNSDASASQPVWTESLSDASFSSGYLSFGIGGSVGNPLDDALLTFRPVEVGVSVDTGSEMVPRHTLMSVPFAAEASRVSPEGLAATLIAAQCTTDGVLSFLATGPGSPALRVCVAGAFEHIWPTRPGLSADLPGASCKAISDVGGSGGNGTYWIDPNGGSVDDSFEVTCDILGGGWTQLQPQYDAYSWRNTICGSVTDSDCRPPSHGAVRPRTQFSEGQVGVIAWLDANGSPISSTQLDALASASTTTEIPNGEVHVYDTENGLPYLATYTYFGGGNLMNTNADTQGSSIDATWDDMTAQNLGPFLAADGRIPKAIDLTAYANWGVFIKFGDDVLRIR
jgi:hypothetical protein